MRVVRIAAIALVAYAGVVVAFETFLGAFQPSNEATIVITTTAADGARDRVVSPVDDGGQLYVSANHWPRSWYRRALANPDVQVTRNGEKKDYRAVPVTGAEQDRLAADHAHSLGFRILTGFAPRRFLRLEPR